MDVNIMADVRINDLFKDYWKLAEKMAFCEEEEIDSLKLQYKILCIKIKKINFPRIEKVVICTSFGERVLINDNEVIEIDDKFIIKKRNHSITGKILIKKIKWNDEGNFDTMYDVQEFGIKLMDIISNLNFEIIY